MTMKTIKIQNCTSYKDKMFKVFVNGEKHVADRFSHKFQVIDDKPFKIRVRYFWDGSPEYAFEPKDNLMLRITVNQRMLNRHWSLLYATMVFAFVSPRFFENKYFLSYFPWLFMAIFNLFARRKKYFIIEEINRKIDYEND